MPAGDPEEGSSVVPKEEAEGGAAGAPAGHKWSIYHKIVIACCYAALLAGEASECSLDVAASI